MSIDPCPADRTKRSRSGQCGSVASNFRCSSNRTVAASAMPIGMPGCPDFAASTASIDNARMALAIFCFDGAFVMSNPLVCVPMWPRALLLNFFVTNCIRIYWRNLHFYISFVNATFITWRIIMNNFFTRLGGYVSSVSSLLLSYAKMRVYFNCILVQASSHNILWTRQNIIFG